MQQVATRNTQGLATYASMQTEADAVREAQIALERLLAAKKAKQAAAHRALAEPRVVEDDDPQSEPSWLSLIGGTVATLVTWAVFGWAVVTVAAALVGGAK